MSIATQILNLDFPPALRPVSAPINSVLLFTVAMVCITPLLSSAGPAAAPREVFRARTLLSVEPASKVRCGCVTVGVLGGWLSSKALQKGLGDLSPHLRPL